MVYKVNTRGRKVEEKLKDSYVSKNVSTKRRPQSSRSSSSSACPTSVQNPSIPKTKSSKEDQENGAAIIPKETVGTKTILSTSTDTDHQTSRSKNPSKTIFNIYDDIIFTRKVLIIPVVKLDTRNIPLHKVQLGSVNNFKKQQEIKPTHDQIHKQIVTTTQLDKTPTKKRGRKCQIDIQKNKKRQESNSTKTTSENVAKSNTSIKDAEPPAKSTRMSYKLRKSESENNSTSTMSQNVAKSNTSIKDAEPPAKSTRMSYKLRKSESENNSTSTMSQNVAKSNTSIKDAEPPAKSTRMSYKLRKSESENNSTSTMSQNVAKSNTSIKDAEPPAKSTRMSLKLRKSESENNSTSTTSQNVAKSNTSIKEVEPTAKRTRSKTVYG